MSFQKHWIDVFTVTPMYVDPITELASRLGIDRQDAKEQHIRYIMTEDNALCNMLRNAYAMSEQMANMIVGYDKKFSSAEEVLDSLY